MIDTREKIVSLEEAGSHGDGAVVVFGSFDVIRAEHSRLLRTIRVQGKQLIACVLPDAGDESELFDAQSRAQLTAALATVDQVVICSGAEAAELATRLEAGEAIDVDSRLERDVVADVLERQSATS